ncbi:hypothetical protein BD324DRAFT_607128 [Kockovaella imperatae]|uniref:Impact N-terminal domain-containing protein n=1 Tax=Kockovaella imperatae TaxID=4999 RepID=A0A1Y1UPN4_9TREE|nr:hypothetical protein BD324DRAFT_607128 [Kockovaella imperatae]ORX39983.1 hypothetical protein BD324DRAFT_607128 [Kockovaella imperatae]
MSGEKRGASPVGSNGEKDESGPSKKARTARPPTLHSWLHPDEPAPLRTHSPPLHYSSSTFLAFATAFTAQSHITSEASLAKECRRLVREINVPLEVGELVMKDDEGAFENGEGRVVSLKGKERAREPDHRMWALRSVCLKESKDGTQGEDDFQLLEIYNDDGEKFGGDRILRILKEEAAIDILVVVCRWYGGDMIGPIRFQHIGLTAKTAVTDLMKLIQLTDLRQALSVLDEEITILRKELVGPSNNTESNGASTVKAQNYDEVEDIGRLERLVKARTRTKEALAQKAAWSGLDSAREAIT